MYRDDSDFTVHDDVLYINKNKGEMKKKEKKRSKIVSMIYIL